MLHRSEPSQMDSGERNALLLPEGQGCYKRIARSDRDSVHMERRGCKSAVYSFSDLFAQGRRPRRPRSLGLIEAHIHTHFPLQRFILVVRCAMFFQSGQRGIWAGVQADYQQHIARAEDKKQHIHSISTPPRSLLLAAFPPHPVFTHSFHFKAPAPPSFHLYFPGLQVFTSCLSILLMGIDVVVSL